MFIKSEMDKYVVEIKKEHTTATHCKMVSNVEQEKPNTGDYILHIFLYVQFKTDKMNLWF